MKGIKKIVFLLCIVALAFPLAHADFPESFTVSITRTLSTLPYDSTLYNAGSNYATVHDAASGYVWSLPNWAIGGQRNVTGDYSIYRTILPFDTSLIPDNANITTAIIGLYIYSDNSTTDFNVTIQHSDNANYPHEPVVASDYYYAYYSGNGGSRNTSSIAATGYWNITLNATGIGWISKTAHTQLALFSSRDIDSIAPSGLEYITIKTYEAGESYSAKLYVTYECEGHNYIIHGPYRENGLVFNGTINVTINYLTEEPRNFLLNGTSGTAETVEQNSTDVATIMIWNITTDYNRSRSYVFPPEASFDEVWLYVPLTTDIMIQYEITVIDLAGLTNSTVETDRNVLGYSRIIERQTLDINNYMDFWLIMYQGYTLKVVSDQGSFSWNLQADDVFSKTFTVTKDMVSQGDTSQNATVTARRLNGTSANVYYYDGNLSTSTITTTIYYHNATGYYSVYSQVDNGNLQNLTVNTLTASVHYVARIVAVQNGISRYWDFSLPAPASSSNIWSGKFDWVGDVPFAVENIVGMFIILCFIAVGSWSDTEWFLGAAIVIAAFLTFIGWLSVPYTGISMALLVVVFMYLHKGRRETGEF